jgi:hypothetical protein
MAVTSFIVQDPGRPFQPSLMFVSKDGAYLSKAPFWSSTQKFLLALPANIRLSWENNLAYYEH